MAIKIKEILKGKGFGVISIDVEASVDQAVRLMMERNIGAVMIVENGEMVGVFTERDVLKMWSKRGASDTIGIKEVMSSNLKVIGLEDDLEYAMGVMINEGIRHLPVVEKGKVTALLSIRDVVKYYIGNLQSEVRYLKDYITNQ